MSTLNTTNIKHAGNSGNANLVLASDGTSTFNDDVTIDGNLTAAAGFFNSNSIKIGTSTGFAEFARAEGKVFINSSTSGLLQITDTANNPSIYLNVDGSAEFTDAVTIRKNVQGANGGKIFLKNDFGTANSATQIEFHHGASANSKAFISAVQTGADANGKGCELRFHTTRNSTGALESVVTFNHDGTATWHKSFKTQGASGNPYVLIGDTITFNLEPDDSANYTTTLVEGEEQQVYSGPTLDVKDRLLHALERIEELEARLTQLEGGSN